MIRAPESRVVAPAEVIRRWPEDRRLAAVLAGDPNGRSRYSLIAEPSAVVLVPTLAEMLDAVRGARRQGTRRAGVYTTGWVVSIPYAAGFELEPSAAHARPCIQHQPVRMARIERGWVHDNRHDRWYGLHAADTPPPVGETRSRYRLQAAEGLDRREAYEAAVQRGVELILAGDAFQVNLTHRLSAAFEGSPRSLFADLADRLAPWHGCYLEDGPFAVASASPELFLDLRPDGRVTTRPMKGTRAGDDLSLGLSPKDAAELAMIVDLMRNDLGRVCAFGSVGVADARSIEPHGGDPRAPHVWQGVATVEGTLAAGRDAGDLLRAAFPPGSVTGAPKIRAMQIIGELEPGLGYADALPDRGPYCGACGFIGDDGSVSLSVAIRTAVIEGGVCHYPVGAGIVADSDPGAEWLETLTKARPFLDLCGGAPA